MKYMMPRPCTDETYAFMLRLYFGPGSQPLELAIRRAYSDFSRTQHGLSKLSDEQRHVIHEGCVAALIGALTDLGTGTVPHNTFGFDQWHEQTCRTLIALYEANGFPSFRVGQAQKWVNMALKYVFLFPELSETYEAVYPLCHVPLDNIIIEAFTRETPALAPPFFRAWSRLDDYEAYLAYQHAIRAHFDGSPPLAAEFQLWQL